MRVISIPSRSSQWLAAVCAFLFSLVLVGVYVDHSERQAFAMARSRTADLAADHAQSLQRGLKQAFSATYAVAALVRQGAGRLNLPGPLQLTQGGLGVVARLSVFLGELQDRSNFWDFTYATLKFCQVLAPARLTVLVEQDYAYELWRTSAGHWCAENH